MFTAQAQEELCKGAARNKDLVAQLQKQQELLRAMIADLRHTSGDVQSRGSVLCCPLWLKHFIGMHTHVSPGLHGSAVEAL